MIDEIVQIENISKTFTFFSKKQFLGRTKQIKTAVKDVSLSIYKGEIFGLLGNNGAGKTTLMRAISSLIRPTSGNIYVCGFHTINDSRLVRERVGFLSSELKLDPAFSPDYLFDFFSKLNGINKNDMRNRKEVLFDSFGINDFRNTKIEKLSTGMKQKISLAISLINDPEIIIFDEPTNGLDISSSRIVCEFIKNLKKQGKTVIISFHIFEIIEKLCDRTGIIINGELKLCDYVSVLKNRDTIENIFYDVYDSEAGNE